MFDSYWRYIVVFVCERRFLVAPIGQFESARQPCWERPGFESQLYPPLKEVVGPILRLAGRQLVCVGRVGRRLS